MTKTTKFYQITVWGPYWFQDGKCKHRDQIDNTRSYRSHIYFNRKYKWKRYISKLLLQLPAEVEFCASFVQSPAARQKGKPERYCWFTDYNY